MPIVDGRTDSDWLPREDDLCRYGEDGFLITPPIVPPDALDNAIAEIGEFLADDWSAIDPLARRSDLRRRHGAAMDHVGYLHRELPAVRELVARSRVAEIAGRLARSPSIRLFHDRLLVKPPGGDAEAAIGWHVDRAYWYGCTSETMLTAWIPFVDVDAAMGPLMVLPGSHRWEDGPLMATSHRKDMDRLLTEAAAGRNATPRRLLMRRGQVSFHHCRIVHGSLPNTGRADRAALAVHLQTGDNRRRRVVLPDGRELGHTNDLLCRTGEDGLPDYGDPEAFPTLWRECGR